jgi:DNA-binding CsgD family transcriptional regulator
MASTVDLTRLSCGAWGRAEGLAGQARTVLRRAGIEDSCATPVVCTVHARAALHRADVPAARRELIGAQRLRHLLTYALPHFAAELRLLPMLATHLSFPEIAAEMFLSPNTIRTQAMSIYRKLGASSRNKVVSRSRELGLLEG